MGGLSINRWIKTRNPPICPEGAKFQKYAAKDTRRCCITENTRQISSMCMLYFAPQSKDSKVAVVVSSAFKLAQNDKICNVTKRKHHF